MLKDKLEIIKKQPAAIFALVYLFVLVVGVLIGLFYISKLNVVGRSHIPPRLADTTEQQTDLKVVEAKTVPPVDVMKISEPTDELLEQGKQLFNTVCVSCHGEEGTGGGPASIGLNPAPRNFTKKENWKNGMKLSNIFETLQQGIPGSAMASYDYLLPKEKFALAHYIRTEFISGPPKDSPEDLQTLDLTYNLSQGKEIPAQIPVADAANLVLDENKNTLNMIPDIVEKISNDKSPGAELFKRVISQESEAISSLLASKEWKGNPEKLAYYIIYNEKYNGFSDKILELTSNDWQTMYSYLNNYF